MDKVVSEWVAIAIVFGLRMIALRYGIKAPEPVDLPRHVRRTVLGAGAHGAMACGCITPAASPALPRPESRVPPSDEAPPSRDDD